MIKNLLKGTVLAVESLVPLVVHQVMVEVFGHFMALEESVDNNEVIIVDQHLAKIKNQILYHFFLLLCNTLLAHQFVEGAVHF